MVRTEQMSNTFPVLILDLVNIWQRAHVNRFCKPFIWLDIFRNLYIFTTESLIETTLELISRVVGIIANSYFSIVIKIIKNFFQTNFALGSLNFHFFLQLCNFVFSSINRVKIVPNILQVIRIVWRLQFRLRLFLLNFAAPSSSHSPLHISLLLSLFAGHSLFKSNFCFFLSRELLDNNNFTLFDELFPNFLLLLCFEEALDGKLEFECNGEGKGQDYENQGCDER